MIIIFALLGMITAELFIELLAKVLNPILSYYDEKRWQKFREEFYKKEGHYPILRNICL